jgi:flagellar assembly factor FliW
MLIKTRYFGEIDVDDQKIITFDNGLIGFEYLKKFTLIYNNESESSSTVTWLQSLDEPMVAFPALSPFYVMTDYNPIVEDDLLAPLGEISPDELLVLVTITVPSDLTKMTVNLKAPFIINAANRKAAQMIVEGYEVKFPVYEILQNAKKEGE